MHGICQIVEKMLGQQQCNYGRFGKCVKIVITFLLVNFAWIFFRMPTLSDACGVIGRIFDPTLPLAVEIKSRHIFLFIVFGTTILFIKDFLDEYHPSRLKLVDNRSRLIRWITYLTIMTMILLTGVFDAGQFIYANF
jgi:hypothetical protein